jgi:hypothetical protein
MCCEGVTRRRRRTPGKGVLQVSTAAAGAGSAQSAKAMSGARRRDIGRWYASRAPEGSERYACAPSGFCTSTTL